MTGLKAEKGAKVDAAALRATKSVSTKLLESKIQDHLSINGKFNFMPILAFKV